jgi:hypothetical protein
MAGKPLSPTDNEHEWRSIDDLVQKASNELRVGEFVASDSFNLYDAMSGAFLIVP